MALLDSIQRARRSVARSLGRLKTVTLHYIQEDTPDYKSESLLAQVTGPKGRGPDGGRQDSRVIQLFDRRAIKVGDYVTVDGSRMTITEVESDYPDEPDGTQWLPKLTATRASVAPVLFGEPKTRLVNGQIIRDDGDTMIFGCEPFEFGGLRFPFIGTPDDLYNVDCLVDYSLGDEFRTDGVEVGTWDAEYRLPYVGWVRRLSTDWNMWDQVRCVQMDIQSIQPELSPEVPLLTIEARFAKRRPNG